MGWKALTVWECELEKDSASSVTASPRRSAAGGDAEGIIHIDAGAGDHRWLVRDQRVIR